MQHKALISVLLPTRNRIDKLKQSIDTLFSTCYDKSNFEILCGVDNDDEETINFLDKYIIDFPNIRYYLFEREGYKGVYKILNHLSIQSSGHFIFPYADDTEMVSHNWDLVIIKNINSFSIINPLIAELKEYCRDQIDPDRPSYKWFLYPIIPKKFIEITGRIGNNTALDTWLSEVAYYAKIPVIQEDKILLRHHRFDETKNEKDKDSLYLETSQERPFVQNDFYAPYQNEERLKDIEKIKTFLSQNNKKIIIIHSYPNTKKQLDVLSNCLDILKQTDYDILLVSHFPIPSSIYKKATYYLFDEDNSLLPEGMFPSYYYNFDGFRANITFPGHTLPITRSMKKSIDFVKSLRYDFFWFMESDCLFSNEDLIKFEALRDQMFKEDKDMIFFKPKDFREHTFNSQVYETLIFGGKPLYFLNKWNPPTTLEEWQHEDMSHMLEYDFYVKYKEDENNFIIVNEHSSDYFNNSQINIFRYGAFVCEILANKDNKVTLFQFNSIYNKNTYKTVTKINGNVCFEHFFCKGCYHHSSYDLNGDEISIDIYEEETYSHTKTFVLTKENLSLFSKRGTFEIL